MLHLFLQTNNFLTIIDMYRVSKKTNKQTKQTKQNKTKQNKTKTKTKVKTQNKTKPKPNKNKQKQNAIIGWGLYFKNKRNLEKILPVSK